MKLNNLKSITIKFFALAFIGFLLNSCGEGCVEADEFNTESISVQANPEVDGVYGNYDSATGGQRAEWHDTGLRSNGEPFLIQISGKWYPWGTGDSRCKFCAKKNGVDNCLCYDNQNPAGEILLNGERGNCYNNINNQSLQDNPVNCTCTKDFGLATDYGVYHIPLNYYEKDESIKLADNQDYCYYDRGMGLYIGLFGPNGANIPLRAYHLFSQEEVCNVIRNSNGKCLDSSGNDITRYVFKSQNDRIFIKDDKAGNDGYDRDASDDEYHKPNENIKLIIYDLYYSDNVGNYNVIFYRGVGNEVEPGLLEYIVTIVENMVLGEIGDSGTREGGIIEFMYKSIVQDTGFVLALQVVLALYITFYGVATLFGVAELNKKELMSRTLKIGLVIFFTSKESWYFYNKIVVAFFKDGMDYVISILMDLSDSYIDESSLVKIAQMDRASSLSQATRFSYVDLIIKKLFSSAVTKKIWGLFFGSPFFGLIYIPAIYALIGYFVYSMLLFASIYLVNVIKLVFVLSLGPVFICFILFTKTNDYFKNWIGYLGARSLEIVFLFFVLYNFLMLIDKSFVALFSYSACVEKFGIPIMAIPILKSYPDRSLIDWVIALLSVGGLMFLMKIVTDQVANLAGGLISIGGVANKDATTLTTKSTFAVASGMMSNAFDLVAKPAGSLGAKAASGALGLAASGVGKALSYASKATGIGKGLRNAIKNTPTFNPKTWYQMNNAFKNAEAAAKRENKTGNKKDEFIRKSVLKELREQGIDDKTIGKRMQQYSQEKFKEFAKLEARKLRAEGKFGEEAKGQLLAKIQEQAKNNMSLMNPDAVAKSFFEGKDGAKYLAKKDMLRKPEDAAKYASTLAGQDKEKFVSNYMRSLVKADFDLQKAQNKAESKGSYKGLTNYLDNKLSGNSPESAQRDFLKALKNQEADKDGDWAGLKQRAANLFDSNDFDKELSKRKGDAFKDILRDQNLDGEFKDFVKKEFNKQFEQDYKVNPKEVGINLVNDVVDAKLAKVNELAASNKITDEDLSRLKDLKSANPEFPGILGAISGPGLDSLVGSKGILDSGKSLDQALFSDVFGKGCDTLFSQDSNLQAGDQKSKEDAIRMNEIKSKQAEFDKKVNEMEKANLENKLKTLNSIKDAEEIKRINSDITRVKQEMKNIDFALTQFESEINNLKK